MRQCILCNKKQNVCVPHFLRMSFCVCIYYIYKNIHINIYIYKYIYINNYIYINIDINIHVLYSQVWNGLVHQL